MKTNLLQFNLLVILVVLPMFLSAQWSPVRFDEHNFFTKITAPTPATAISIGIDGMTGSFVLRTNDGGASWDSITISSSAMYSLDELFFTDVNHGFAGGLKSSYQSMIITTDNGSTWTERTPDPASINPISAISFVNPQSGYASDETTLYRTQDAGLTWTSSTPGFLMRDIQFTDMDNGYACGTTAIDASISRTMDGGATWNTVFTTTFPFFTTSAMQKLDVINSDVVYSSGQYSNQLFRTIDGGITWDSLTLNLINGIQDFDFTDVNHGRVVSTMGEIYGTIDGGLTWNLEYAVATGAYGPSVFLVSVSFSGSTGYVCGSSGLIKKFTDNTVGLSPEPIADGISIYPNPSSGNDAVNIIGLSAGDNVEVYNVAGQLAFQKNNLQSVEVIQLNLPAGMYTLLITNESKSTVHKLVVMN